MLWLALVLGVTAVVWWWRTHAQARCRDCGSRAVFCSIPFVCAARRQGLVKAARSDEERTELPPPEELL